MGCILRPGSEPESRPCLLWGYAALAEIVGDDLEYFRRPAEGPVGVYWVVAGRNAAARGLPLNSLALMVANACIHGPAVVVPPWEKLEGVEDG